MTDCLKRWKFGIYLLVCIFVFSIHCIASMAAKPAFSQVCSVSTRTDHLPYEDLQAVDLLRKMEATYQSMKSFSSDIQYTTKKNDLENVSFTANLQYRKPAQLVFTLIRPKSESEWTQCRTDGQSVYLIREGVGDYQWAEAPHTRDPFDLRFNIEFQLGTRWHSGINWLAALFSQQGLLAFEDFTKFQNLTLSRPFLYQGVEVQNVTASTSTPKGSSRLVLTIGISDHLLYLTDETTTESDKAGNDVHEYITAYLQPQSDPAFNAQIFGMPVQTPSQMTVTNISDYIHIRTNGQRVKVRDELSLYNPGGYYWEPVGRLQVIRVKADECLAVAIELNSISPGEIAVLIHPPVKGHPPKMRRGSKQ